MYLIALNLAYTLPLALHVVVIALYTFVIIPYYRYARITCSYLCLYFSQNYHEFWCEICIQSFHSSNNLPDQSCTRFSFLQTISASCLIFLFYLTKLKYPKVKNQYLTTGVVFGIWVEAAVLGRFLIATVGTYVLLSYNPVQFLLLI